MMNKISHKGIVEDVGSGQVIVRILQTSACAACKVAGHCSAAESKEKRITVKTKNNEKHSIGDHVVVFMNAENGRKAVMMAFVYPFILMVAVLMIILWMTDNEGLAAMMGIAVLIPYYVIIYLLRDKIAHKFNFMIEESSKTIN